MLLAVAGVRAQDCESIVLPLFGGDADRLADYPAEKLQWRCSYARNAFYVSDTVPPIAYMHSITEVKDIVTGESLPENFAVDLTTLSYYAYTFKQLQLTYRSPQTVICFATPGSAHPYLVLRSLSETYDRTENPGKYSSSNK